jgi:DNA primase
MQPSSKYLEYLHGRGLSNSTIKAFGIGYCDPLGSCSHPEYIPQIDFRFYDTVLFPIRDLYNNLVAVASRSVDVKKYIHSKYSKRRHLFGLNVTHTEILKTRKVFVVEGNFDLLTLYEHGIKNAVAMLGSKLSMEQLSLLVRFADEIIIASDGDEPGQACADKIKIMLRENNINYRQLNLPIGSDPDSFIKKNGADAFLGLQTPTLLEKVKGLSWEGIPQPLL